MDNSAYLNRPVRAARKNCADAACKSFQRDEASSVCVPGRFPQSASFPDTANFVGSCLRMIAGIPFANSNRKRLGADRRGGRGREKRSTVGDINMSKNCYGIRQSCAEKSAENTFTRLKI